MKWYTTKIKFHVITCLTIIVISIVIGEIRAENKSTTEPAVDMSEESVRITDSINQTCVENDDGAEHDDVEHDEGIEDNINRADTEAVVSQAVKKAEEYEKNKLYKEGIKTIDDALEIVPDDERLLAIRERIDNLRVEEYVSDIAFRTQKAIETDGFGSAYRILLAAVKAAAGDKNVTSKVSEYKLELLNEWKAAVINRTREYSEEDVAPLLSDILEVCAAKQDDIELTTWKEFFSEKYKKSIIGSIEAVYDSEGCTGVVSHLKTASELLAGDKDILNEYNVWKRRASVYADLSYVNVIDKYCVEYNYSLSDEDRYGTMYTSQMSPYRENSYIELMVGDYAKMMGVYYISSMFESVHEKYLDIARVRFFNENDELIGELSPFESINSKPVEFCIDIRSAEILRIEFTNCFVWGGLNSYTALGNVHFCW